VKIQAIDLSFCENSHEIGRSCAMHLLQNLEYYLPIV